MELLPYVLNALNENLICSIILLGTAQVVNIRLFRWGQSSVINNYNQNKRFTQHHSVPCYKKKNYLVTNEVKDLALKKRNTSNKWSIRPVTFNRDTSAASETFAIFLMKQILSGCIMNRQLLEILMKFPLHPFKSRSKPKIVLLDCVALQYSKRKTWTD